MRRSVILLTILVAMVSVVLVGCGSQKDEDEIELDILVNQMQSGTWTPISSRFDVGSGWWDFENPGDGDFVFLVLVKEVAGDYLYRRYVGTYVIDKKRNPTGSFKDRGMVMAIAKALEAGKKRIICASTGNTAASLAAMQRDLEATRNELREIKSHIGDENPLGSGMELEKNTRSSNEVLGELRLLRTLFSQLTSKKGAKKSATPVQAQSTISDAVRSAETKKSANPGELMLDSVAPGKPDAKGEYRASYMGLSGSLQTGEEPKSVQFPSANSQHIPASSGVGHPASSGVGNNAQDILAITRDALERAVTERAAAVDLGRTTGTAGDDLQLGRDR